MADSSTPPTSRAVRKHGQGGLAEAESSRRQLAQLCISEIATVHADAERRLTNVVVVIVDPCDSLGALWLGDHFADKRKRLPAHDVHVIACEHDEVVMWFHDAAGLDHWAAEFSCRIGVVRLVVVAFDGITLCELEV